MTGPAAVVVAAAFAACGGSEDPAAGETSDRDPVQDASDQGSAGEARRGTALASVTLDDGRKVELRAAGVPPYEGVSPCLMLFGIDQEKRQCGTAPSAYSPEKADDPIVADAYARANPSAPLEVYGTTQPGVARVVLEYGADGARRRQLAVRLEVSDREVLERAHISEPFGYFFGELPSETSIERVRAIALDPEGETLGSVDFGVVRPQPGGPESFIAGPS